MKTPNAVFALALMLVVRLASAEASVSIASFTATEIDTDAVTLTVTFHNLQNTRVEVRTAWRLVDGSWVDGQVFTTHSGDDYTVAGLEWGRSYQFRVNIFPVETTLSSVIAEATTFATTATPPLVVPDAPVRKVRGVFEQIGGVTVRVGCSQDGSECGYRAGEYGDIAGDLPGSLFHDGQPRAPTAAYEVSLSGSVRWVLDPRPPTPTSQTRRPTPYSGPAGGSERHPVFASERMPLADGPARSASLADPVQVLPQLDYGWNVGTSQ